MQAYCEFCWVSCDKFFFRALLQNPRFQLINGFTFVVGTSDTLHAKCASNPAFNPTLEACNHKMLRSYFGDVSNSYCGIAFVSSRYNVLLWASSRQLVGLNNVWVPKIRVLSWRSPYKVLFAFWGLCWGPPM